MKKVRSGSGQVATNLFRKLLTESSLSKKSFPPRCAAFCSTPRRFFKRSRFKRGAAQSSGALPWQPGANAAAGRINRKRTGAGVLRGLMLN